LYKKTALYFANESDLPDILKRSELQFVTISDIRHFVIENYAIDGRKILLPRIEIDYEPNPDGQVILPTVSERLRAAETLINLILDEGGI